jgi:hypothetical protein
MEDKGRPLKVQVKIHLDPAGVKSVVDTTNAAVMALPRALIRRPGLARPMQLKITPEMIEAGADVIWRGFGDVISYGSGSGRELALEVFEAMIDVARGGTISLRRSS